MLPGTFGVFETFRILIPGYIAALCATWYIKLFIPGIADYLESTKLVGITFAGFGLAVGLVLYLAYLPKDSRKYRELLPSTYINTRATQLGKTIDIREATEIYFYLLNNYFSDSMRERIFYYGNIYRVAQKTWLISISFFIFGGATLMYLCFTGGAFSNISGRLAFEGVLLILFLLLRWSAEKHAMQILSGQIKWLKMRDPLVQSLLLGNNDPHAKP